MNPYADVIIKNIEVECWWEILQNITQVHVVRYLLPDKRSITIISQTYFWSSFWLESEENGPYESSRTCFMIFINFLICR